MVVALLSGISVFAQLPPRIAELQKKYESYFDLNRETIFLHLNKTAVVPPYTLPVILPVNSFWNPAIGHFHDVAGRQDRTR